MSSATARTWATISRGETASIVSTPTVFCAVIAVIARHPVHAAAGERLQIGLDAGSAAGVRAGDREHCGYESLASSREPRARRMGAFDA